MVYPDDAIQDGRSTQIVYGQVATPLVLVLDPREAPRFARLLVARKLDPDGLAVLGKYGDNVTLCQLKGQTTNVDEGRIAVVGVPGALGIDSRLELALVELLDGAHRVHDGGEA